MAARHEKADRLALRRWSCSSNARRFRPLPQPGTRRTRTGAAHRLARAGSDRDALRDRRRAAGGGRQQLRRLSSRGEALPRVGALLDPDTERILSLRPDLVITYGSQGSVEAQLARAGIRTFSYRHGGVGAIVQTVRDLGSVTGRASQANGKAREIETQFDNVRAAVRGYARPRVLLVFGRQPQSLRQMCASGGAGFLNDILEAAGGQNVFSDVRQESVQPSQETLLARAPDVIIEIRSGRSEATTDAAGERSAWSPLASIPAVRNGRIHLLTGAQFVVPGPRVGLAAEQLARMLHPEAFK